MEPIHTLSCTSKHRGPSMSAADQSPDLSTAPGLLHYLSATPFASSSATALLGGTGNFVFRIRLLAPHEGRETLVAKHAKGYLPSNKSFEFPTSRQSFEVGALRRVGSILGDHSLVMVPAVHHFDEDANVIIMDDAGEDAQTLKEMLLGSTRASSPDVFAKIGAELGAFLARLHILGTTDTDSSADAREWLGGNSVAKRIAAFATYRRLSSTLTGSDSNLVELTAPPLALDARTMETVALVAQTRIEEINTSQEAFLMGDFWPGNVLVRLTATKELQSIMLVDWELTRIGRAGMDIGQFIGDVRVLMQFVPEARQCAGALSRSLVGEYATHRSGKDKVWVDVALTHMGAHLVAWGPRIPYNRRTREATRDLVVKGVEYLKDGFTKKVPKTADDLVELFSVS